MTVTIQSNGGTGIHAIYSVFKERKLVATISCFGPRHGWEIVTNPYRLKLGEPHRSIEMAKRAAVEIDYPTMQEAYEKKCQQVQAQRRFELERSARDSFVRLARAILAGSNSAHEELAALVADIDQLASDRTHIGPREDPNGDRRRGTLTPYFPKPPE